MIDEILIPKPVPEIFTLQECLYWLSDQLIPVHEEFEEYHEKYSSPRCFLMRQIPHFSEEKYDSFYLDENDEPNKRRREWKEERSKESYESLFEKSKIEMLLALKQGDLKAYGYQIKIPENWDSEEDCPWEEFNWKSSHFYDWFKTPYEEQSSVEIPADFWRTEGVRWEESAAASPNEIFLTIHIKKVNIFEKFPPQREESITISKSGDYFINNAPKIETQNKRKPTYNWPEFHAELTRYIEANGRPKQTAVEHTMAEWCVNNWGREPSHGALHAQISPHFEKSKKNKLNN